MDQQQPSPSGGGGGTGVRWEPHGRALTACLVALNVFLVYAYFWRFFSRRPPGDDASSSAASSPPASPKARDRLEVERAITALPVFVVRPDADPDGGGGSAAAAECAICIAELAGGEEGRLLPRCGHRFHARCVDAWFRFHTTCPLCRASVLAAAADDDVPAAAAPATPPPEPDRSPSHRHPAASGMDTDSPV